MLRRALVGVVWFVYRCMDVKCAVCGVDGIGKAMYRFVNGMCR